MEVLQVTNHGLHEWRVTPGLPDTGGQNVYVNEMSAALVRLGHQVTIVNRGGYPHPLTGEPRAGTTAGLGGQALIVYLSDGTPSFVRKEDMAAQIPALVDQLDDLLEQRSFDLIISHYWDGGLLGALANQRRVERLPHIWIPHSLGALKRRNVQPEAWPGLRVEERITAEKQVLQMVDGVAATSVTIRQSLRDDYGIEASHFLPPGVDQERYHPRSEDDLDQLWGFIAEQLPGPQTHLRDRPLVLEVSRTDATKRKDVLIKAFAAVREVVPNALLAVTIDGGNQQLHDDLLALIADLDLTGDVVVLGSVWDWLPYLYAASDVYCTPSVMEGFGMSAQEASASGTPVVASDLVPFVSEFLLGNDPHPIELAGADPITVGEGAIVVPADSVPGFAKAMTLLLTDTELRRRQGEAALAITVPTFGWDRLVAAFLDDLASNRQHFHD